MISKYGIKIKNFQAGALYQCNLGVRENYDYTRAMFTNNLLLYYLMDNGLKVNNGWTRDIICIEFDYGSRSYEEEIKHLDKCIKIAENENDLEKVECLKSFKTQAELKKDLFNKKSADEIREIFYTKGVEIRHDIQRKNGKITKQEYVHYNMLYRSTGKAKDGSCMFICDRLYKKALNFIRMGIKMPKNNAPIVEMGAYSSLIASSIIDTIHIDPKNILILKDVDSYFTTNIISIETDKEKHCIAIPKENYQLKNTMFDGQGLIDESIFPKWGNGYLLLRHHMCKMACFKTRIQKFFKDYYKENYENAIITDMFGIEHYAKDIKLITTENAMKWLKFDIEYEYWCKKVYENKCTFGIVKTAHKSKLGEVQKMSYQMINSLDMDVMPNVVNKSKEYIELLKRDNNAFLKYLKENKNFSNDFEVLVALCEQNKEFTRSDYFRYRKANIIEAYVNNFKFGKVLQNADNLVFVGSPYAMLLYSVGESVEKDKTFKFEEDAIQCFTNRFKDNEYLACFRSPHNSKNNISYLHNVYSDEYLKYFDLGEQIIVLNVLHTPIQDRMNGCDFDSDSGYVTNQTDIVKCAKRAYINYPTIVNNIAKDKNNYNNDLLTYARIDNMLSHAQSAIGLSSNLAQFAQTYMYNFNDQKYKDYVCILSVLAQCAIDNAKRTFDINIVDEIDRIKQDMEIEKNGVPMFWKHVKDYKAKVNDKKFDSNKINKNLQCPMNYLMDLKFTNARSNESTLPMSYFFEKFDLTEDRRKCRKVEELIEKYSIDLFIYNVKYSFDDEYRYHRESIEIDFEELLNEIKTIYISKNYLGLMSWLIDRAFCITPSIKQNKILLKNKTNKNKSLLIKILYDINSKNLLQCFSKNCKK